MNMTKALSVVICCGLLGFQVSARAEDWKPAPAPLMTRWGKSLSPETAWAEYPRPQLVRDRWQNLNGLWDYAISPRTAEQMPAAEGKILVPYAIESALSGVGRRVSADQSLWYSRTFEIPSNWRGSRVMLHFDAVDWETEVMVNGQSIGGHKGGSTPFSFDITDAIRWDGANQLRVRVWDPTDLGSQPRGKQVNQPEGIWYTPVTGIWQTVWLEPIPVTALGQVRTETQLNEGRVRFHLQVNGPTDGARAIIVVRSGGREVAKEDGPLGQPLDITIPSPRLWSPSDPHLYECTVELKRDDELLDRADSYFGMREIRLAKDEAGHLRLFLNGKPLFQFGPLDQGWWPDGLLTPPSDAAAAYDLQVLKQVGMNMLRKHIKVEPSRYYYHCDRLGLMVWQDMPSGMAKDRKQFVQPDWSEDGEFNAEEKAQFRAELKEMIDHLRGFTCIVTWVPFNEGWGQHDTNEILQWVMEYDPTRLVDGPSGWTDRGVGHMKDLHRYPGPDMFSTMPDRASVLGEFGGLGLPVEGHLWKSQDNWGYRTFKTVEELEKNYRQLIDQLKPLIPNGLAAAIYTQTTDVEIEVNGLLTYDREVLKLDAEMLSKLHEPLFQ
jgi:beta-galactosidase/beta-glucuronidase